MTVEDPGWRPLIDCEGTVDRGEELEWRQVLPNYIIEEVDGGLHVENLAFQDDTRCVSTSRESIVSAEEAYVYRVTVEGKESAGTWAVSVSEVGEVICRVIDDSNCDGVDTPGHSYIDMRHLDGSSKNAGNRRKQVRQHLAARATTRGRQHPPS
jgi:hypothetical protein